jgi:Ca2+-transporting ATPase
MSMLFFAVLVTLLVFMKSDGELTKHDLTIFFNVFVLLQFWNLFNARALNSSHSPFKGLFENKSFILIAVAILVGQIVIVQLGGAVFRTVPLSLVGWLILIVLTSSVFWIGELYRMLKLKRMK